MELRVWAENQILKVGSSTKVRNTHPFVLLVDGRNRIASSTRSRGNWVWYEHVDIPGDMSYFVRNSLF